MRTPLTDPLCWRDASFARRLVVAFGVAGLVAGAGSCRLGRDQAQSESGSESVDLSALAPSRTIAPRLSIDVRYVRCAERAGTMVDVAQCPTPTDNRMSTSVLEFAARASRSVQERVSTGTLRTAALIDLMWHDSAGNSVGRSIKYLRTAARLDDRSAAVLADLSAAYIVRAERTQSPRDLLEAMEAASRAIELDPTNEAAHFNVALAEERLGLMGEAQRDWDAYAQLDPRSDWGVEAGARSRSLAARRRPRPRPRADAPAPDLIAFAQEDPQAASMFGWQELLGDWGSAMESGDTARAAARLASAGAIGDALAGRQGDATLSDAVRTIRDRADDPYAQSLLATSHRELATGMATHDSARYQAATPFFERSLARKPPSNPLVAWATVFRGLSIVNSAPDSAERLLAGIATGSDTLRYPSLVGRARWGLGTTFLRRGRYESALEAYRAGTAMYARAGENENVAALHALTAQAEFAVGDEHEGFRSLRRSLVALRDAGEPVRLHNVLYALHRATAAEGLFHAARVIADEDVAVTERSGLLPNVVEARVSRARLRAMTGLTSAAATDRDSVRATLTRLAPDARLWFNAHLQQVDAEARLQADVPPARPRKGVGLKDPKRRERNQPGQREQPPEPDQGRHDGSARRRLCARLHGPQGDQRSLASRPRRMGCRDRR